MAFLAEALILLALLAYLLTKWGVSRVNWIWFVVLSTLGSIAFALPAALETAGFRRGPCVAEAVGNVGNIPDLMKAMSPGAGEGA